MPSAPIVVGPPLGSPSAPVSSSPPGTVGPNASVSYPTARLSEGQQEQSRGTHRGNATTGDAYAHLRVTQSGRTPQRTSPPFQHLPERSQSARPCQLELEPDYNMDELLVRPRPWKMIEIVLTCLNVSIGGR